MEQHTAKQYEVLNRASLFLAKHNREEKVAEILLQHYLGQSRAAFFANMRDEVPAEVIEKFQKAITEHAETGIPVQHLTGYEVFYGRKFSVNKHTLIPRPETEELIQQVLQLVNRQTDRTAASTPITIADIGTGSGIIAATLALELEHAHVFATDISSEALHIAKQNADHLGANVAFMQGDFLQPLITAGVKADIIVSNPPYIARNEAAELSDTVKNFDPDIALFAAENGLYAYKTIIEQAAEAVTDHAHLAFEIGYTQGKAVQRLIKDKFPACRTQIVKDMNKKDRMVITEISH